MAEPYSARLVVVAEGPSERQALPLLYAHLGLKFDDAGISISDLNRIDRRRRWQNGD